MIAISVISRLRLRWRRIIYVSISTQSERTKNWHRRNINSDGTRCTAKSHAVSILPYYMRNQLSWRPCRNIPTHTDARARGICRNTAQKRRLVGKSYLSFGTSSLATHRVYNSLFEDFPPLFLIVAVQKKFYFPFL